MGDRASSDFLSRRQFTGAVLGALIAALTLPFERFAAWVRAWLQPEQRALYEGVNGEFKAGGYEFRLIGYSQMVNGMPSVLVLS